MEIYALNFDSMTAFGHYMANIGPRVCGAGTSSETTYEDGYDWDHGLCYQDALKIAENGGAWEEGARNLQYVKLSDLDTQTTRDSYAIESALCGFAPIVPNVLAGIPDNMFSLEFSQRPQKIISVFVDSVYSCKCSSTQLLNRGKAILASIDALEAQGYRVELFGLVEVESPSHKLNLSICLKRVDENYNPASVAFMLCCAAFLRRLMFMFMECTPEFYRLSRKSYGNVLPAKFRDGINICNLSDNTRGHYNTPESALQTVKNIFDDQLLLNQCRAA